MTYEQARQRIACYSNETLRELLASPAAKHAWLKPIIRRELDRRDYADTFGA